MAKLTDETRASLRRRSRLVNLGRDVELSHGFVNLPPFRGSTVLYPDVETLKNGAQRYTYGRRGTPTLEALSSAWTDLCGAAGTKLVPSGIAAIVASLMAALSAGDHLLMSNSVYGPSRAFADRTLKRMGIETTYYDPRVGAEIDALMRPNTRAVFTESPGSKPSRSRTSPPSQRSPMPAARALYWTTPGRRRCSSRRIRMAWTSRSKRAPNIFPDTRTSCSVSSRPTRNGSTGCIEARN